MERIGSGIRFMLDETKRMGHPSPQFKQTSEFVVTFYKAPDLAAPKPQKQGTLWTEYAEEKPVAQTQMVLNAQETRLTKAMQYVQEHGSIANKVYRELTGVSDRTATRDLETLVERGRLRSIGKRRSRHYEPS